MGGLCAEPTMQLMRWIAQKETLEEHIYRSAEAALFVVPSRGRLFCLHVPAAHLISELRNHFPDGFVVSVTGHMMTVRKRDEAGEGGATSHD